MNAQQIKDEFKQSISRYDGQIFSRGATIGVLEKACGGTANRYLFLKELTGKTSSRDLSEAEFYALFMLVRPCKPLGGHWTTEIGEEALKAVCGAILTLHVSQAGQLNMFASSDTATLTHAHTRDNIPKKEYPCQDP